MTSPGEDMNREPPKADALNAGSSLLHRAWRHRRLVSACTLAGALIGGLYYLRAPHVYQSAAQILVSRKHPDLITGGDTRNGVLEDFVSTHQDLLRSRLVIDRAVTQAQLAALPSFASETDLSATIANHLSVSRTRGTFGETNVLQLTFRAGAPDDARVVLKALLKSYQNFLKAKYHAESSELVQLIRQAQDELARDLERKWNARAEFRKRHRLVEKSDGVLEVRRRQLQDLQAKRSEWVLRKAEIQAQLTALDKARRDGRDRGALLAMASEFARRSEPGTTTPTPGPTLQDRLLPLLEEEQKLLATHGAKHPEVEAVRQQIAATRAFFTGPTPGWSEKGASAGGAGDPLEQHVRHLRQKLAQAGIAEEALTAAYERALDEASRLDQEEMQDAKLKADFDRTQELYDSVVKRVKAADLSRGGGGYEADVVSAPTAGILVAPRVVPAVPLSAALGLLVGLGLAYLITGLDNRFEPTDQVRERLGAAPTFARHHPVGTAEQASGQPTNGDSYQDAAGAGPAAHG
jgi:uncharacterized protein involved in exopolysaccharide biosynthesis